MGGNMGLFLGGSALTIIQILEYCYDEAVGCCTTSDQGKKRPKSPVVVAPVNTVDNTVGAVEESRSAWGFDNNGTNGNVWYEWQKTTRTKACHKFCISFRCIELSEKTV